MARFMPKVGPCWNGMISAVRMYRDQYRVMAGILILSMLVHILLAISICLWQTACSARTVAVRPPDHRAAQLRRWGGSVDSAGLGSFEIAMDELYRIVPPAGAGSVWSLTRSPIDSPLQSP